MWEIELDKYSDENLFLTIKHLKEEANFYFFEFIKKNYQSWLSDSLNDSPLMSHNIMKELVFPKLINEEKVFFILIDNLRLDQWLVLKPLILESFLIHTEGLYCSILPTTTEYARNSIFSSYYLLNYLISKRIYGLVKVIIYLVKIIVSMIY